MTGPRRQGRVAAVQVLYELDAQDAFDELAEAFPRHFESFDPEAEVGEEARALAEQLCQGVVANRTEIDRAIERASQNWRVSRMARVDRNVLRVAVYELRWCPEIPAAVVLNEAIEIAKEYGGEESAPFVNGVLDRVVKLAG